MPVIIALIGQTDGDIRDGRAKRNVGGIGGKFETTPLVIGGVMYLTTPFNRVVALEPWFVALSLTVVALAQLSTIRTRKSGVIAFWIPAQHWYDNRAFDLIVQRVSEVMQSLPLLTAW